MKINHLQYINLKTNEETGRKQVGVIRKRGF